MKKSAFKIYLFVAFFFLFFSANAYAGQGQWEGRHLYDFIMRWVNFAIMVFLFAKYAWGPLIRWLRGQGEEVAAQLNDMKQKKQAIMDKMAETKDQIKKRSEYLDNLMARTTEKAKQDKDELIKQTKAEGRQMIENASRRAEYQILEAKKNFRGELVDEAISLAGQKLPEIISTKDELRVQEDYLTKALQ